MTTQIDLTGIDVHIKANVRGGTRRLNLKSDGAALDLTGVTAFEGEVLASATAAVGSGTDITWPVVDASGGGVTLTIPAGLTAGNLWCYVTAEVAGDDVEISGPLQITGF